MKPLSEPWTVAHELALVFVALAYGTDQTLKDEELATIRSALASWASVLDLPESDDTVVEAVALLTEPNARDQVKRAIHALRDHLDADQRRRAIADVIRIAEADGILLTSERGLIDTLARVWDVKATTNRLLDATTARVEELPDWSLLHDLALLYVVLAHSTDNDLSRNEIHAIQERLSEWQPELTPADIEQVLREALGYYADGLDQDVLQETLEAIRDRMPEIQRLGVLNDLIYIAESDGVFSDEEKAMISSVSAVLAAAAEA